MAKKVAKVTRKPGHMYYVMGNGDVMERPLAKRRAAPKKKASSIRAKRKK